MKKKIKNKNVRDSKMKEMNKIKYCPHCQETAVITIRGLSGYCKNCDKKIFTLDTKKNLR